jgi:hypothetical protein
MGLGFTVETAKNTEVLNLFLAFSVVLAATLPSPFC